MPNHHPIEVCILAAGLGKRMKSDLPKALLPIAGQPMLSHLLKSARSLDPLQVHVVIGKQATLVQTAFSGQGINFVLQPEQKGTGHAVMQAAPHIDDEATLLILLGDAPLVTPETMQRMVSVDCDLGVLTVDAPDPYNYGRIVRGAGDSIQRIVEERDADESQKAISEINTGVMVVKAKLLKDWLDRIDTNNAQNEYLLTDIVALAAADGKFVRAIKTNDTTEALGVNNFEQLATLEREQQLRLARQLMLSGVHILDPARIDVRGELNVGAGTSIDVNCIFEGNCSIGDNVVIGSNCSIRNAKIGSNVEIKPNSVIDDAVIGDECSVGPFARIRPGTVLARDVHIGNFVEVKKSTLGEGTKASHLTYLGDATIGAGVNVGAGTITCNYDGVNKHQTLIGDNVFVGSNTALVAPVTLSDSSWIAAGSTITRNVSTGSLAIARGRQRDIDGWSGPARTADTDEGSS